MVIYLLIEVRKIFQFRWGGTCPRGSLSMLPPPPLAYMSSKMASAILKKHVVFVSNVVSAKLCGFKKFSNK
jgi:hypothetical protein